MCQESQPRLTSSCVCSTILWDSTPCSPVEAYQCFGGKYCLHLQAEKFTKQVTRRKQSCETTRCVPEAHGYCLTTSDLLTLLVGTGTELGQQHILCVFQPGHRIPRFSAIHWAVCVPASCDASDVQLALADTLQRHVGGTGITFRVRVTAEMCQTKDDRLHLPTSTLVVG
jgi:hypothetical protein